MVVPSKSTSRQTAGAGNAGTCLLGTSGEREGGTMMNQATLTGRVMRAAKVAVNLFEDGERDETATSQALSVVIIVAVAGAIGSLLGSLLFSGALPAGTPRPNPIVSFILPLILVPIGWVVWSYITYFVGTRLFGGTATPG